MVVAVLWLLGGRVSVPGADWSQWRGPGRDGVVRGDREWPARLDARTLQRAWRVTLGSSYSGPLIAGDKVFATEAREQRWEAVVALDRETGREVWRREWEGYQKVPFFAKSNGDWIRSTPALEDGRLYVGGMRDVLVCLEAATGKELWRYDFPNELGKAPPDFGFVSSPLVVGDGVHVQAGAGFAKLDRVTGRLIWRSLDDGGGMWGSAFSSPVRVELGGEGQFVVQTRDILAGVRPSDGEVLWRQSIKAFRGMNILTPVVAGNRLMTSAYGGQTQGWSVGQEGGKWKVREEWKLKLEGYMSTPVVVAGHAYLHTRAQRLVCVEMESGRKCWESEEKFGKYMSLVAQGDRVLGLDQRGELLMFGADPGSFREQGRLRVAEAEAETWAHVAVAGEEVVVRELGALAVWRWVRGSSTEARPIGPRS